MKTKMTLLEFRDNLNFFGWSSVSHTPHKFIHNKSNHVVYIFRAPSSFAVGESNVVIQRYNAGAHHYSGYSDALVAIAKMTPGFKDENSEDQTA